MKLRPDNAAEYAYVKAAVSLLELAAEQAYYDNAEASENYYEQLVSDLKVQLRSIKER